MKRALPFLLLAGLLVLAVAYLFLPPAGDDGGEGAAAAGGAATSSRPAEGRLDDGLAVRRAAGDLLPVRVFAADGGALAEGRLYARVDDEPVEVAVVGGLAELPRGAASLGAAAEGDGRWSPWTLLEGAELAAAAELRLELADDAAALRLRVTLDDGSAAPRPRLLLSSADPRAAASLPADGWTAGADGVVAVDGLAPGAYVVELHQEGCIPHRDRWTLDAGARLERALTLQRAGALGGSLLGPDGPVAGARVLAVDAAAAQRPFSGLDLFRTYGRMPPVADQEHGTDSGADGGWRIDPLPPGAYLLLVHAEGLRPFVLEPAVTVHAGRTERVGIQELVAGNRVEVLVRGVDGQPQQGAELLWRSSAEGLVGRFVESGLTPVRTGADGRAVLRAVADGLIVVEARHPSSAPVEEALEFAAGEAAVRSVELRLEAGATLAGSVLREGDGAPVADATLGLYPADSGGMELMLGTRPAAEAESDADGAFLLARVRAGSYMLKVEADGYAPRIEGPLELAGATALDPLLLGQGATLEVLARDSEGQPLAEAMVAISSTDTAVDATRRTDAQGRALFEALAPGNYQVALVGGLEQGAGPDGASALDIAMRFVDLEAGEHAFVELGGGGPTADVEGFVTRRGQPVAGAVLVAILPNGAKTATSGADGRYALSKVPVGDHVLMVQMRAGGLGGGSHACGLDVPAAGTVRRDVQLPGAAIEVVVRDAAGGAVAGMPVSLRPLSGEHIAGADFGLTDGAGRASFDIVAPGDYQVSAGRATMPVFAREELDRYGARQRTVSVAAGSKATATVELRLDAGATFRVRVSDAAGEVVSGASMHYLDAQGQPLNILATGATNSKGVAQLTGLPAGPGRVLVRHADHGVVELAVDLRAGEVAKQEVTLEAGTLLLVDVVDGDDQPLGGVLVVAVDARGAPLSTLWTMEESQQVRSAYFGGGAQRLGPLPPGRYTVKLVRPGHPTVEHAVTLQGEPERRVRLPYRP